MSESRQTALITGATSGIGLELTRLFARDKFNLILVARNEQSLKQLADELQRSINIDVRYYPKDLSLPQSPEELFRQIQQDKLTVDILVNNAGFATHGIFSATNLEEELSEIQLNITAPMHLTKLFLPEMLKRRSGKILNVSSTAGFQPGPFMAVYYASKAFLLNFSQAIAEELEGTGVSLTVLCPGPTATQFQIRAGLENTSLFRRANVMDARTVAKAGYSGLLKGKRIVIPGIRNKILMFLVKFSPRWMVTKVVRILNRKEVQSKV